MKILALTPTIDLSITDIGMTPVWWQLCKAFAETGNEVVVIPYFGKGVQTLWWRCYENPRSRLSSTYRFFESRLSKLPFYGDNMSFRKKNQRTIRWLSRRLILTKWKKFLSEIIRRGIDIDIILILTIPLNSICGLATAIKREWNGPVVYYDGDSPVSLPKYGGLSQSFYVDADLSEYDAFVITSKGAINEMKAMGAQKVYFIAEAADPDVFSPMEIEKDIDVTFFGIGTKFREDWMKNLITIPSRAMPKRIFAVGGKNLEMDLGAAVRLGMVPYRKFSCRGKINLNITREPLAETYCSSSSRLFELASMQCCIVSNPALGLSEWFTEGKEIFIAKSASEAIELYSSLLDNKETRLEVGRKARQRVLREHTYRHRAHVLMEIFRSLK